MTKRRKPSTREDELNSSSESSADDEMSPYETTPRRGGSEARRNTSKEDVIIMMLADLQRSFQRSHRKLHRDVKKLSRCYDSLSKQLEPHNNGTSGDGDSTAQRSPISNQVQPGRYELVFTSGNIGVPFENGKKKNIEYKIEMGQTIDTTVALVDRTDRDNETVKNGPLASVRVEFLVVDDKAFNQHVHQSNYWSIEELERCIKTTTTKQYPAQRKSVKVTNSQFNLIHGVGSQSCSINTNSGNSKFRLAVRVVSSTKERVLEGFSNPFYVRDLVKPNKRRQALVANGYQEQNSMLPNMQKPSWPNPTQDGGRTRYALVDNSNQGQNGQTPNLEKTSLTNSIQTGGINCNVFTSSSGLNTTTIGNTTHMLSAEPSTSQEQRDLPIQDNALSPVLKMGQNGHAVVDNSNQGQNGQMPNLQTTSLPNSIQTGGINCNVFYSSLGFNTTTIGNTTHMLSAEPSTSQEQQDLRIQDHAVSPFSTMGQNEVVLSPASMDPLYWIANQMGTDSIRPLFPVRLLWDRPNVELRKRRWNVFDHLIKPPREHFGSLSLPSIQKSLLQTRQRSGVLIEPLEPDDSEDEQRPLKSRRQSKYQLRFVNKVCEVYYTRDQIKADDGNHLMVALFDENNTKITSGPLSSASVEVVALHGDFNVDGQDYWTSEEFNRSVVCLCPPPGEKASSVLGGDRIFVLADGETRLSDAFFQISSFCSRTGKFKMGVMLSSAQDERVQEGISEPFRVIDRHVEELHAKDGPTQGFNPAAATVQFPRDTAAEAISFSVLVSKLARADLWALVDAALDAAARDRPDELRARRDGIVERLYAAAGSCSNCNGRPPPPRAALAAAGLDEEEDGEEAAPASPVAEAEAEAEADVQAGGAEEQAAVESRIVAIRDFLEDRNQPEDDLLRLLQSLADMDVTYNALQGTDIGRQVNGLRKHPSAEVRRLVKQLIRKWKEVVDDWVRDDWVRLHNSGGDGSAAVMTADGDSPDKIQGRSHQSTRVSGFQYSPSPQRQNGSASERANNGFESTMDAKRRASPVPAHHNSKQMSDNHSSITTMSSAPAKVTREQRQSLLDLDKLDSARKRLLENCLEAQNAKKQRTIQVMDINDIPKPKSRNAFIRKSSSGGLPARNR